jgi:phosphatidate cytidylyltransferase
MKRVLTAVVLVPLVLLAVFWAPLWLFALLVAGIIVLALHEYLGIAEAAGIKPFRWLTYIFSLFPILGWEAAVAIRSVRAHYVFADSLGDSLSHGPSLSVWLILALLAPVLFGACLVFRKDLRMGLASTAVSAFGIFYVAAALTLLVSLRGDPAQSILVIFVLFSVWAGDIAAYYVGRSIGKHKLAPIVSPNKSWEGAIASVIGSVALAALVFHFQPQISRLFREGYREFYWLFPYPSSLHPPRLSWVHVIILGILTNVAAQFGDLFESALKRGANVKDSGTLLPGHGGVLDRIDALLFAIPVVWYYAQLTGTL